MPTTGTAHPGRVLVLDGRSTANRLVCLAEKSGDLLVARAADLDDAASLLGTAQWHLLLIDPSLAVEGGRALVRQAQALVPGIAVAMLGDTAGTALGEMGVTSLPADASELEQAIRLHRMVDQIRLARHLPTEVILAIGAHPDDVEIGIGGTLLAHRAAGHAVNILTLTKGAGGGETSVREIEAHEAAHLLGAQLFLEDLEDRRVSGGHPTVGLIEHVIDLVQPTIIYTHSIHDTHQDHRAVHHASLVAGRNIGRISCYQAPSATIDFRPNRFVPVDAHLEAKLRAISAYESQTQKCDYLHPEVLTSTSRYWSRFAEGTHAEALEVVRDSSALPTTHHQITEEKRTEPTHAVI
jgi:LmbE family N-acetylglucosaminyl deacetylase